MTVPGPSAAALRARRTDLAQPPSSVLDVVTLPAGGVESMAAQIAAARGAASVMGIAGGPEKCRYLVDELGLDAAIDHHDDDLDDRLAELAPGGITASFDTVGGPQFRTSAPAHGVRRPLRAVRHPRRTDRRRRRRTPPPRHHGRARPRGADPPLRRQATPGQIRAWNTHYARWYAEGRIRFARTVLEGTLQRAPSRPRTSSSPGCTAATSS
jgi:hypothetical protein